MSSVSSTIDKNEVNLSEGKILSKIIRLSLPLVLTNVLQLLFNAADVIILSIFVSDEAVAAVGANNALITLFVNLFVGFAVGANVVLSKAVGERDPEKAHKTVGTSIWISLLSGLFVAVFGVLMARTFLIWMRVDESLLELATLYLRIYFLGMPVVLLYNFTTALLRAVGDTLRPMYFLLVAGIINVGLNIFFVLVLNMTVDGVAYATIISQAIAGICALIVIIKSKGYCRLTKKYFRIFGKEFKEILKIGLPSGLQSSLFSVSNVLIQSSINSLGKFSTLGSSVGCQFDSLVFAVTNSISLAAMTFVGQNYGANEYGRIKKGIRYALLLQLILTSIAGWIVIFLSRPLSMIMTRNEEAIHYAQTRIFWLCSAYFLCGFMDTFSYALRAVGKSVVSMIISLLGSCVFRMIWLWTVFVWIPQFRIIFIAYPITWIITTVVDIMIYVPFMRKQERAYNESVKAKENESLTADEEAGQIA